MRLKKARRDEDELMGTSGDRRLDDRFANRPAAGEWASRPVRRAGKKSTTSRLCVAAQAVRSVSRSAAWNTVQSFAD